MVTVKIILTLSVKTNLKLTWSIQVKLILGFCATSWGCNAVSPFVLLD